MARKITVNISDIGVVNVSSPLRDQKLGNIFGIEDENKGSEFVIKCPVSWDGLTKNVRIQPTGAEIQSDDLYIENIFTVPLLSSAAKPGRISLVIEARDESVTPATVSKSFKIDGYILPSVKEPTALQIENVVPYKLTEMQNQVDTYVADATDMVSNAATVLLNTGTQYQPDFVETIKTMCKPKMRYFKNDLDGLVVVSQDKGKYISHTFVKEALDDFIKWTRSLIGSGSQGLRMDSKGWTDRTGTWVDSSAPNYYCTGVGATFTAQAYGSEIRFCHFTDNRGGVWNFTVDGVAANSISTWNATAVGNIKSVVATGLDPFTLHTVIGTFAGDDPLHAPSGGVSRGWAVNNTADKERQIITGYMKDSTLNLDILTDGSNRDFALNGTYNSTTVFLPEHNSVGSAFKIDEPVYYIDNALFDFAGAALYTPALCSSIQIVQHFHWRITGVNVAEVWHTTTVDNFGVISFAVNIKALQTFTIVDGYTAMLPLKAGVLDTVLSSFYTQKTNAKNGSRDNFVNEKDLATSFIGIDQINKSLVAACTVVEPLKTNRLFQMNKDNPQLWALNSASYLKIYNGAFKNYSFVAGQKHQFYNKHIVGYIPNAYEYFKN